MDGEALKGMIGSPEKMADLFSAFDVITEMIVVEPPVKNHKLHGVVIDQPLRDPNFVYTDDIDMNDKSFLFQFSVGGTGELETFREERDAALVDLENVEDVSQAPE